MKFIIDRFEEAATLSPDSLAVVCEDGSFVTYASLNDRASCIAKWLIKLLHLDEVVVESEGTPLVGLLMERHIGIITMMLGVHKAGCAYVPVDPAFPPDRQAYILEHSRCNVLIVDEECFKKAKEANMPIAAKHILISAHDGNIITYLYDGTTVSDIMEEETSETVCHHQIPRLNHNMEALAYVLYTSGSTGKPKGVAVKQVGVDNIIHFFAEELQVTEKSRVLGLTTFCFDISVLEIFLPLTRGGCFILALSSTRKDPFRILELMDSHEVDIFQATPTTYEMLLATGWTGDVHIQFLVGGEAFRPSLLPIAQHCASLLNVYGPTETTIWSTSFRIEKDFANYSMNMGIKAVPIGKAISQTLLYVVGENQPWSEVAQGEEGELWIGGVGVAAGYLHAPHLTQERFIQNPFGEGYIYRTGDVVKQLSDGNFVFVRRLDDQVKIDGFRIELEEIEKVYMEDDHVEKAVALVRSNKIVIYLLPSKDTPVTDISDDPTVPEHKLSRELLQRIHERAATKLTYYMIPKYTVIIKDFIKTPNGKLDKKALPDPRELRPLDDAPDCRVTVKMASVMASRPLDADRPVSSIICEIIQMLRGHYPSIDNNLGGFGLDSLGSVMLLRQISNAFHGEVSIKLDDLFVPGRTIRDLGQLLYDRSSLKIREKLHLISEKDAKNSDWESLLENGEGSGQKFHPMQLIDYYGASLLANKRLFEGLRGVFTFMVLYDHWHSDNMEFSNAMTVDTTFFYLLSGFTTASQLRIPLEIKKKVGLSGNNDELELTPKEPFQVLRFWLLRAVGLYPILWLNLVLYAPAWYLADQYQFKNHAPGLPQSKQAAVCTFLDVFGMDVYSFCLQYGPGLRFASALINCMLFYGIMRYIWSTLLRKMTLQTSASKICSESVGFSKTIPLRVAGQTWGEYFGKVSLYLSYNLYHPDILLISCLFFLGVPVLLYYGVSQRDLKILNMFSYFLGGAWLLAASEMLSWCRIVLTNHVETGKSEKLRSPTDDINYYVSKVKNWCMDRILAPNATSIAIPAGSVSSGDQSSEDDHHHRPSLLSSSPQSILIYLGCQVLGLVWRFLPDAIAVVSGILMSCKYGLCRYDEASKEFTKYNADIILPCLFSLFVLVSVHQRGSSRYNFSRLFLESDVMNFLGYTSYTVYVLQDVFLKFYFTFISHHKYAYHPSHPSRSYFKALPLKMRAGYMILFILISWVVQAVYQDYLVANLFSKAVEFWSKRRQNRVVNLQYSPLQRDVQYAGL
eukprot:gene739-803_t